MKNLKSFREALYASANHLNGDQMRLFEPFVCHGNPYDAEIFFVGTNGVLDDASRPMLAFDKYWSDEPGFDFVAWHRDLGRLPGGYSKTRLMADHAIAVLKKHGLDKKVLSTNVYSTGSPSLAKLRKDHRVVAPFEFLLQELRPKVLFVFGTPAKTVLMTRWSEQIAIQKSPLPDVEIFTLLLNGRTVKGIFTKHLSMHVGYADVAAYAELLAKLYQNVENVASYANEKPISVAQNKMQNSADRPTAASSLLQTIPSNSKTNPNINMNTTIDFEKRFDTLLAEIKLKGKIHVKGSGDTYYPIIELNGGIALERDSGKHKKLSTRAMKDLYETGKHIAQQTNFVCTLSDAHKYGDLRYCAAIVKYMKGL